MYTFNDIIFYSLASLGAFRILVKVALMITLTTYKGRRFIIKRYEKRISNINRL